MSIDKSLEIIKRHHRIILVAGRNRSKNLIEKWKDSVPGCQVHDLSGRGKCHCMYIIRGHYPRRGNRPGIFTFSKPEERRGGIEFDSNFFVWLYYKAYYLDPNVWRVFVTDSPEAIPPVVWDYSTLMLFGDGETFGKYRDQFTEIEKHLTEDL